jgi:hypothetical protein
LVYHLLRQGLAGRVIAAVQAHGVVNWESGVPAAEEGLWELLGNEAELQEQADGALTQQQCQPRGVVDGEEVELAILVEAALEDQGVEMRVKPERLTKGLNKVTTARVVLMWTPFALPLK